MKRHRILALCLLLLLCLFTGCGAQEAKGNDDPAQVAQATVPEKSPLQAAFEEGKTFALVKAEQPKEGEALGGMPISLSPDGNTWLWKADDSLFVVRNGQEALPMKAAPDRGIGDPYGTLEKIISAVPKRLPGIDGIAWSPDSRYALMLSSEYAEAYKGLPMGLMLLDAETGEVFLAAAYAPDYNSDHFGAAFQGAFDRSGKYLYYVDLEKTDGEMAYAFKRCDLSDFQTEVLSRDYSLRFSATMIEDREGNWLVTGNTEESRGRDTVLWLFSSDGRVLQKTVLPLEDKWALMKTCYSPETGYGLGLGRTSAIVQPASLADTDALSTVQTQWSPLLVLIKNMNWFRITPEGVDAQYFWHLKADSRETLNAQAVAFTDDAMQWLNQVLSLSRNTGREYESEEQKEKIVSYAGELDQSVLMSAKSVCLSPDGHYVLMYTDGSIGVRTIGTYRFYLVDLETLETRPVESPWAEGNPYLTLGVVSYAFYPCMEWENDGTLLIYNSESGAVEAWTLEVR